jgi:hypothetical protein
VGMVYGLRLARDDKLVRVFYICRKGFKRTKVRDPTGDVIRRC